MTTKMEYEIWREDCDILPVSPIEFDQVLYQLEADLGLDKIPTKSQDEAVSIPLEEGHTNNEEFGMYGPVAGSTYTPHIVRRPGGRSVSDTMLGPLGRQSDVHSQITPLFHNGCQPRRMIRASVDGSNLERLSDSVEPLTFLHQTRRHSSTPTDSRPDDHANSTSIKRSRMANFNRQVPYKLRIRRMSQQSFNSLPSDTTSNPATSTPTSPPYTFRRELELGTSPQQLPRLEIPKNSRPPITPIIENATPVRDADENMPGHSVSHKSDMGRTSSLMQIPELELPSELIDLDSTLRGLQHTAFDTEKPDTEPLSESTYHRLTSSPPPRIHKSSHSVNKVSPCHTETYFTISDYETNEPSNKSQDFHDFPLASLQRKESHISSSSEIEDELVQVPDAEMTLRDYVRNILRRSDSQRQTTRTWSALGSEVWNTSATNSQANHSARSSLSSVPSLVSDPNVKTCTTCYESFDISECESRATAFCRHEPTTCPICMSSWIQAEIRAVGCNEISCPELFCPFLISAENVHQVGDAKTIELQARTRKRFERTLTVKVLSADPSFHWCRKPDCKSGQFHHAEPQGLPFKQKFRQRIRFGSAIEPESCEGCQRLTCHECRTIQCAVHQVLWKNTKAIACPAQKQYLESREAACDVVIQATTKACPECKVRIEKVDGCDKMTCSACQHIFCWICLADYSAIRLYGNSHHGEECPHHSENITPHPFDRHVQGTPIQQIDNDASMAMEAQLQADLERAAEIPDERFETARSVGYENPDYAVAGPSSSRTQYWMENRHEPSASAREYEEDEGSLQRMPTYDYTPGHYEASVEYGEPLRRIAAHDEASGNPWATHTSGADFPTSGTATAFWNPH